MTAIAGMIRFDGCRVDQATLERMQNLLAPYGRDAQHHCSQGTTAFLRTLLRTTPEDSLDHQPLVHPASGTTLLFDGRLDNRDELADALGLTAADMRVMSDSAVVLQVCLRWETQAVARLLGDFAIACWQAPRRRLWLARDPLGVRPLFWHRQAGFFAFATMPKALFAIPGVPRALCEERLHDYLCLLPMTGPESFFKDIYRVEPGEVVVLDGERVTATRYHSFDPNRELKLANDDDYVEGLREQLDRAVACRLRTNGPIASHLSSGFDSSTVTAVAARQLAERNRTLLAYTAVPREGFDGPVPKSWHADEGPAASAVAARFANIEHILIRTVGTSPIDNLWEATERLDRAPLNPCNLVWTSAIEADAARRGARVLLKGTLGNMTISYDGAPYLPWLLGHGHWLTLWRQLRAIRRRYPKWRWRPLIEHCLFPYIPASAWLALQKRRGFGYALTDYSAIHPAFRQRMHTAKRARDAEWDLSYRPWSDGRRMRIAVLNRLDNGEYSAAVNAQGLEERSPAIDLRLVEFCLAVPDAQYLGDGQPRWLLQRLMADVLPEEILKARTKGKQAADWHVDAGRARPRLREALAELRSHGVAGDYLDLEALTDAVDAWPESGWGTQENENTYRLKLLRGLSVGGFIRYTSGGNQ